MIPAACVDMERDLKKRGTTMTDIHESIIVRIFIFLSAKSIFRCTSVCKTWATLISQLSKFSKLYSNTRPPLQFLVIGSFGRQDQQLVLTEFDQCDSPVPITKSLLPNILDPPSWSHELRICSTCNFTGFVVAYAYAYPYEGWHPYHLFNPLTTQHIVVQQNRITTCRRSCALVFAPKTNQLKLLKFIFQSVQVDIQTIGTGLWRTIGETPRGYFPDQAGFPVFLNGSYHWLCDLEFLTLVMIGRKLVICVFNAEDEVFNEILTPSSTPDYVCSNIGVLDECLCICFVCTKEKGIEFWIMNEYGVPESWTNKFAISTDSLEFNCYRVFEPLRYLENGEILILCHPDRVISYNLNTKNCTIIKKYYGKHRFRYETIPYVPCFSKLCGPNGEIL